MLCSQTLISRTLQLKKYFFMFLKEKRKCLFTILLQYCILYVQNNKGSENTVHTSIFPRIVSLSSPELRVPPGSLYVTIINKHPGPWSVVYVLQYFFMSEKSPTLNAGDTSSILQYVVNSSILQIQLQIFIYFYIFLMTWANPSLLVEDRNYIRL